MALTFNFSVCFFGNILKADMNAVFELLALSSVLLQIIHNLMQ